MQHIRTEDIIIIDIETVSEKPFLQRCMKAGSSYGRVKWKTTSTGCNGSRFLYTKGRSDGRV